MAQGGPSESGYHFIQDYRKCKRLFHHKYIIGLEPLHTSPTLLYGNAIHAGLESYYEALRDNKGMKIASNRLVSRFRESMAKVKEEYVEPDYWVKDLKKGEHLLQQYPLWYSQDITNYKVIGVEHDLWMPVGPSGSSRFTGRIDLVWSNNQGNRYIVDHKTTGWSIKNLKRTLGASDQATAYMALWNYHNPKMRVNGVIFNILREYQGSIDGDRLLVYKTQQDIDDFVEDLAYDITDLQNRIMDPKARWPKNTESCFLYNRPCPFLEICQGANYQSLVGLKFKQTGSEGGDSASN